MFGWLKRRTPAPRPPAPIPEDSLLDWPRLLANEASHRSAFASARPFPWLTMDGFLREGIDRELASGFREALSGKDPLAPKKHRHVKRKIGTMVREKMTEPQRRFFDDLAHPAFMDYLERITGISPLFPDKELNGGGLHEIHAGGYLNVHVDFNFHPASKQHRRLNLIVYLNERWEEDWGGLLELWPTDFSAAAARIVPLANRMVLFETSEVSYHGHPVPLAPPEGVTRKSLAVYYYSAWPKKVPKREKTGYVLLPWQKERLRADIAEAKAAGAASLDAIVERLPQWEARDVQKMVKAAER
jgi:hypothetical protein